MSLPASILFRIAKSRRNVVPNSNGSVTSEINYVAEYISLAAAPDGVRLIEYLENKPPLRLGLSANLISRA